MSNKKEIKFKSFEEITEDIYKNQQLKGKQIDLLIQELHSFIQTADDALMIAPIIKEYFDVAIKNDEHLVKLASVIQRYLSKSNEENKSTGDFSLSDEEKADLMNSLEQTVNGLQKENDRLEHLKQQNNKILDN
tara:strand:+ start:1596 stop:1997 length:402 start_codon:yes stop_codon:yes gene_type:complete